MESRSIDKLVIADCGPLIDALDLAGTFGNLRSIAILRYDSTADLTGSQDPNEQVSGSITTISSDDQAFGDTADHGPQRVRQFRSFSSPLVDALDLAGISPRNSRSNLRYSSTDDLIGSWGANDSVVSGSTTTSADLAFGDTADDPQTVLRSQFTFGEIVARVIEIFRQTIEEDAKTQNAISNVERSVEDAKSAQTESFFPRPEEQTTSLSVGQEDDDERTVLQRAQTAVVVWTGDVDPREVPATSKPPKKRSLWKRSKRIAAICVRYVGRHACGCFGRSGSS